MAAAPAGSATQTAALTVREIGKKFGGVVAIRDVSLRVAPPASGLAA